VILVFGLVWFEMCFELRDEKVFGGVVCVK
jgi:hypothetical protein